MVSSSISAILRVRRPALPERSTPACWRTASAGKWLHTRLRPIAGPQWLPPLRRCRSGSLQHADMAASGLQSRSQDRIAFRRTTLRLLPKVGGDVREETIVHQRHGRPRAAYLTNEIIVHLLGDQTDRSIGHVGAVDHQIARE